MKGTSSASAALHNAVLPVVGDGRGAWSILSAIVQSAEDAIVSTDLSGVIMSWNPGAERLCGYSAAEMLGRSIFLTVPPERLEEARDMIAKAEQGQLNLRRETVRIHKDGTRRFVSLSISAIKDANGKPVGIAGIAHDIAPLRLTEATRREAEDRLRLAQEAAGVGIWDWSVPSSGATSEQCFRTYGLPASETEKGFLSFAAGKSRKSRVEPIAAKVRKPCSELNPRLAQPVSIRTSCRVNGHSAGVQGLSMSFNPHPAALPGE